MNAKREKESSSNSQHENSLKMFRLMLYDVRIEVVREFRHAQISTFLYHVLFFYEDFISFCMNVHKNSNIRKKCDVIFEQNLLRKKLSFNTSH